MDTWGSICPVAPFQGSPTSLGTADYCPCGYWARAGLGTEKEGLPLGIAGDECLSSQHLGVLPCEQEAREKETAAAEGAHYKMCVHWHTSRSRHPEVS